MEPAAPLGTPSLLPVLSPVAAGAQTFPRCASLAHPQGCPATHNKPARVQAHGSFGCPTFQRKLSVKRVQAIPSYSGTWPLKVSLSEKAWPGWTFQESSRDRVAQRTPGHTQHSSHALFIHGGGGCSKCWVGMAMGVGDSFGLRGWGGDDLGIGFHHSIPSGLREGIPDRVKEDGE